MSGVGAVSNYEEESQHASAVNRLSRNRQENWMNPMEYSLTRRMLLIAVRNERIGLDQAAYAAKVAGLTTALAYCLVAVSAMDPLTPRAYLLCSGPYAAAGMAAAGNELNNEMYYAKKEYSNANSIAAGVWDRRNKKSKHSTIG